MKDIYKFIRRRNLPHIQPADIPIFVTYNLALKLPDDIKMLFHRKHIKFDKELRNLDKEEQREQRIIFEKEMFDLMDDFLGKYRKGPLYLQNSEVAKIVWDSLLFYHNERYKLFCFCIMPNHVHVLLQTFNKKNNIPISLSYILQSHKGFTARESNKVLKRKGTFWQDESYDHYARNENEFYRIVWYIINNPVKAELVENWKDWEFTWIDEDILRMIE